MKAPSPVRGMALAISAGLAVVLVGAIIALLSLVIAASGFEVGPAFGAMLRGAAGSPYAILSATLVRATPLILTGLAVALAFRGGILNIGAEGQLLAGAAAATAVVLGAHTFDLASGRSALTTGIAWGVMGAALIAAAAAGAAWAAIPAWLRLRLGVLEVITTIMMNFVALYAVGYLVRGPLQEPLGIYPQSPSIPDVFRLPMIVAGSRLHAGFVMAVAAAAIAWYVLRFTAAGFRLRLVGANAAAAASAGGVNVARVSARIFLTSGAIAGVAGGVEVLGVTYALYENLSPGYGYTAIAVALLAGLSPALVVASGIFLGALAAGAAAMQREAGVPLVLVSVVEALVILAIVGGQVALGRLATRQPRADVVVR